jgi:sugar phosphate permease
MQPVRQQPAWIKRLPFFYGWVIVGSGILSMMATSGATLWGFAFFSVPIGEELGWSRSTIFLAITLRAIVTALTTPLISRLMDEERWPRPIIVVSGVVSALSIMSIGLVQEIWQYYLLAGVLGGLAGAGGFVHQVITPKWFVRMRGRAVSFVSMGSSSAALIYPLFSQGLIAAFDWRWGLVALGMSVFLLKVPLAFLIWRSPEDLGLLPDGDTPESLARRAETSPRGRRREEHSFTVKEVIRTPTPWLLAASAVVAGPSLQGLAANWAPYYRDVGVSASSAALAVTAYGFFAICGRTFWGLLAERYHIRSLMVALTLLIALTTLWQIQVNAAWMAITNGMIQGLTLGGYVAVSQLIWPDYFGRQHLGAIRGIFTPFSTLSSAGGPFLLAAVSDLTGSYRQVFLGLFVGWLIAACCQYLARAPQRPGAEESPAATRIEAVAGS